MKHAYTRQSNVNSKAQANMHTSWNNQCDLDMQCSYTWTMETSHDWKSNTKSIKNKKKDLSHLQWLAPGMRVSTRNINYVLWWSLCTLYLLACQMRGTVGDLWWSLCTLYLLACQVRVTVGDLWWSLCTLYLLACQVRVTVGDLWWSLCTLYLLACQVRVTVGDLWWSLCTLCLLACQVRIIVNNSGLCCCVCEQIF